jgi:glycosyltransferase involved in cell wall biosynthesis
MFAHNLNYEGAPISQFELTRALIERKSIAAEVIAFNDGPMRSAYEAEGIVVTVVPSYLDRIPTLARLDRVIGELAAIIRNRNAEVVYANTLLTFAAVIAAHEVNVPSIWNPRESEPWETYFGFLSRAVAQSALTALTFPYRVAFVAEASRQAWSRFDVRHNFTVIRNGLDIERFGALESSRPRSKARQDLGYANDDFVFLCVGTICERKGQRDLIQAFGILSGQISENARLCLVGDEHPGYGRQLRSDIALLPEPLRGKVSVYPAGADVRPYYAAADVFVLCSLIESYPRVILEAMTYGLPVITTPVFGVLEQVSENENALFFEPGNVAQLARNMDCLLHNKSLCMQMAGSSLKKARELTTFDEMVRSYEKIFQDASFNG